MGRIIIVTLLWSKIMGVMKRDVVYNGCLVMYDDRCDACECDEWVFMRAVDRDDAS